ncbi:MAG: DUF2812 domain-containing protein [Eubacteriales bacterium]|nr:DUF2812 domain-containing protein [Eubacteriales bacterium]
MKDKKRRFEVFSFYDRTGMERHLERMAEKGWMLEKMGAFGWVYRKIQPRRVRFAVSYFPSASEYDPDMTEEQREFQDFCRHTGWELAACSGQLQIFSNVRENPVPIETDPELEVENLHKTAKKSFLTSYFVLLAVSAMNLALGVSSLFDKPLELLSSVTDMFPLFAWGLLLILCAGELGCYYHWLYRARREAREGIFLETRGTSRLQRWILWVLLVGMALWLGSFLRKAPSMALWVTAVIVGVHGLIFATVFGLKTYLKKRKVSANWNRALTLGLSFVIAFALVAGGIFTLIHASNAGLFEGERETYEYRGSTFSVYRDKLPLTVEDLTAVQHPEEYNRRKTGDESPLLARLTMQQRPRLDAPHFQELPSLSYTVTEVKLPWLYGFCREQLLSERKDQVYDGGILVDRYEPVDPAPWGAEEAYRVYWSSGYLDKYLLCYNRTLVELTLDWEPTAEQMGIVGEKLGK